MSSSPTWRSYLEFRDIDPHMARILTAIEKVRDKDDPDRLILRNHSISRVTKMKARIKKEEGVK